MIRDRLTLLKMAALLISAIPFYFLLLYVNAYGLEVPVHDQWYQSTNVAYEVKNQSFDIGNLIGESGGHRAVFTYLSTAILTVTTNWNPLYETYLAILLAVIRLGLIILIVHAIKPELTFLVLIPVSLLIFSVHQGHLWLSGIHTVWHFVSLFALAAVFVLTRYPVGWRPLVGAALLAFCAAFSQGSGLVVFPVMTITLWMFGYRHWKYYLFWTVAMAIALLLYFQNSNIDVVDDSGLTAGSSVNFANLKDPITMFRFVLIFIGNPFYSPSDLTIAPILAFTGITLFLLNIRYLRLKNTDWSTLAPWMTLAGIAPAIGMTVYLTRYRVGFISFGANTRYILSASHFWVALLATSTLVGWHFWHETESDKSERRWRRALIPAHFASYLLFTIFFLQANVTHLQTLAIGYDYDIVSGEYKAFEDCVRYAPLAHNRDCFDGGILRGPEDALYRLAYYGLTVFSDAEAVNILPEEYRPGTPIILDTPTPWMNAYLRKWYLGDPDETLLFHVALPPDRQNSIYEITSLHKPLTNLFEQYDDTTTEALAAFLDGAETVWYLRTREMVEHEAQAAERLNSLGYVLTVVPFSDPAYNQELFLSRYDLPPESLENQAVFDAVLSLQSWRLVDSVDSAQALETCQPLRLQTWWTAVEGVPETLYGLQAVILNADGTQISIKASGLTHVPHPFWVPRQLYVDERLIPVPCDLPPGEYSLAVGVNRADSGDLAPLEMPEDATLTQRDNWLILETFNIPAD